MSKVIGIDLGTTNSCVAIFSQGRPTVIPNQEGSTTTPSVVAFIGSGPRLTGAIAKRQLLTNPEHTLYSVKRLIGRKFDTEEVRLTKPYLSYDIAASENGDVVISVAGRAHSAPEIQAEVLASMKKTAEAFLGEKVAEAVITVPAYFNDAQRQATKDAGLIAGLKVLRIINEPTAASLAYGLDKSGRKIIAVYDLGGGTFDLSILEIGDGVFQVRSTSGDTFLGGDDFDRRIINYFLDEFRRDEGLDISQDKVALQRLKDAAESAKHILSNETQTTVNLPFISITDSGPKHFKLTFTRAKLEELVEDLIQKTLEPCRQALRDGRLKPGDIQEVILVGGQTRMPRVREVVRGFFGREPHAKVNPDEVVAVGAAIQGAVLQGEFADVLLLDVTPISLGMETKGGVFTPFIERNTTIPTRKTLTFTTTEDNQSSVTVHVLQGERAMAADNISLAKFDLIGIPPAPRGLPKIEVTFDIDANGILSVSAKDLATNQSQAVRVTASGGLSKEDIESLVKESAAHALEDEERRLLAGLKNDAEATVYAAENLIHNYAAQFKEEQVAHCRELILGLRGAILKEDRKLMEKNLHLLKLLTNAMLNAII